MTRHLLMSYVNGYTEHFTISPKVDFTQSTGGHVTEENHKQNPKSLTMTQGFSPDCTAESLMKLFINKHAKVPPRHPTTISREGDLCLHKLPGHADGRQS